ncbi:mechanosensitive ion channel family protein [Clostridium sp. Cult1]|uniref:mechanosensitive ion channel family protein n=1 Tax=Clostridium sp. Cult1 TaxID=2079002 RepID=UPI001F48D4F8|nr:mechanosensitive ion channel family protein [Clostridium sp. Cult1]MCF6463548.1 mechanosensitive ion channel protein MscS [Clostridium sp. Cult1]
MDRVLSIIDRFFKTEDGNLNILGKCLKIILVFIIIRILIKVSYIIIDKTVESRKRRLFSFDEKKINTLTAVLKNIMKYVLYFIGTVIILDMFNINTSSILATAGIGGLAIGFGAQSLVKDVITGFFILFEDQFSVGDYVKIDSYEGIVEELGVRVTKLRDFSGELHIIPNGNINTVTNKARGAMRALVKVSIAYEEDIDRAIKILDDVCNRLKQSNKSIEEGPTILGVSDLGEYGVDITIVAKTKPMDQWGVERALRKEIKEAFDRENIEIPYPRMVILDKKS